MVSTGSLVAFFFVVAAVLLRSQYRGDRSDFVVPDQSKTNSVFLITGANTGLGYASAEHLIRANSKAIIITARSKEKGEIALAKLKTLCKGLGSRTEVSLELLDLSDLDSVAHFNGRILNQFKSEENAKIVAILNAGVMVPPYTKTAQGFELQFGVNHLAHFAIAKALAPISNRFVVVSSSAAYMGKKIDFEFVATRNNGTDYSPWEAYAQSKLLNLLFANGLRKHTNLEVISSHPGFSHTDLQRNSIFDYVAHFVSQDASLGSLTQVMAAVAPLRTVGLTEWFVPSGFQQGTGNPIRVSSAPPLAADQSQIEGAWNLSEKLLQNHHKK